MPLCILQASFFLFPYPLRAAVYEFSGQTSIPIDENIEPNKDSTVPITGIMSLTTDLMTPLTGAYKQPIGLYVKLAPLRSAVEQLP